MGGVGACAWEQNGRHSGGCVREGGVIERLMRGEGQGDEAVKAAGAYARRARRARAHTHISIY